MWDSGKSFLSAKKQISTQSKQRGQHTRGPERKINMTNPALQPFFGKDVILDTKPLLILLLGIYEGQRLSLLDSNEKQFGIFIEFLKQTGRKLVTPHVLSELSNIGQNELKGNFGNFIRQFTINFDHFQELHVPFRKITPRIKELERSGITATVLIELVGNQKNAFLLTGESRKRGESLF